MIVRSAMALVSKHQGYTRISFGSQDQVVFDYVLKYWMYMSLVHSNRGCAQMCVATFAMALFVSSTKTAWCLVIISNVSYTSFLWNIKHMLTLDCEICGPPPPFEKRNFKSPWPWAHGILFQEQQPEIYGVALCSLNPVWFSPATFFKIFKLIMRVRLS